MTPEESEVFGRLLGRVRQKQRRNKLRTSYFDAKKRLDKIGFSIPPSMRDLEVAIGWGHKAVKVPSRRIRPDGFVMRVRSTLLDELSDVMDENFFKAVERMAIESSLQHSVAFVFVTPGDESVGEPQVIITARTALEATAEINPRTGRVTAAIELVSRKMVLMYLPGRTLRVERGDSGWFVSKEYMGVPHRTMCTPYIWGRSLERPFGYSRITRPLMGYIDMGVRTLLRQEVTAEFYSGPQRTMRGAEEEHFTDENGNRISPLDALIGGVWAIPDTRDEETGDLKRVDIAQLPQVSMQPHSDMLRTIGMMVSSETSIPVGYLGIIHDNPSSGDAMRVSESDLNDVIEGEFPSLGMSREDLARNVLSTLLGDWSPAMEADLAQLKARFMSPSNVSESSRADGLIKQSNVVPEIIGTDVAFEKLGYTDEDIQRVRNEVERRNNRVDSAALIARFEGSANHDPGATQASALDEELKRQQILRTQLDAIGIARRAGVNAEAVAAQVGLPGLKFAPGTPITLKQEGE